MLPNQLFSILFLCCLLLIFLPLFYIRQILFITPTELVKSHGSSLQSLKDIGIIFYFFLKRLKQRIVLILLKLDLSYLIGDIRKLLFCALHLSLCLAVGLFTKVLIFYALTHLKKAVSLGLSIFQGLLIFFNIIPLLIDQLDKPLFINELLVEVQIEFNIGKIRNTPAHCPIYGLKPASLQHGNRKRRKNLTHGI